jgi:hypothetical protein
MSDTGKSADTHNAPPGQNCQSTYSSTVRSKAGAYRPMRIGSCAQSTRCYQPGSLRLRPNVYLVVIWWRSEWFPILHQQLSVTSRILLVEEISHDDYFSKCMAFSGSVSEFTNSFEHVNEHWYTGSTNCCDLYQTGLKPMSKSIFFDNVTCYMLNT